MRASPACQVTLEHFGWWRAGVGLLAACSFAAAAGWLFSSRERLPLVMLAGLLLGTLWVVGASVLLMRREPLSLRWDSQTWHLGPAASVGEEPWPGQLSVALDFGAWMLLCFRHQPAGAGGGVTWIPVQRSGLRTAWHAFRCAVYSARPESRGAATARPDAAE